MGFRRTRGVRWSVRTGEEIDRDIDDEVAFHIGMRAEALMKDGMSESDALARAQREFGDVDDLRRALQRTDRRGQRRRRLATWLDDLVQDIAFAARSLIRTPGFLLATLATLGIGIGAAVATFTVVNDVVLRPLPYEDSDRILRLSPGQQTFNITLAETLESGIPSLESVSGITQWELVLTGVGDAARIDAQGVEPEFFDVFRVRPALGRPFIESERDASSSDVVVLSHDLWQTRFGGDGGIIGRRIQLDGSGHRTREVIGVMPAGFVPPLAQPGMAIQAWIPLMRLPGRTIATDSTWYVSDVVARMRTGATVEDVARSVQDVMARVRAETGHISEDAVRRAGAASLLDSVTADLEQTLWTALGAVMLVLLLACANVANLLLARSERRSHELAARAALGATRLRLVRTLITESALLAIAGAAAGVLLARGALELLRIADIAGLPRAPDFGIDVRVLAFAIAATALCVLLFGVLPAVRATSGALNPVLGPGDRMRGQSRGSRRIGALLIGGEVALAMVLVTAAGLLIASFRSLRAVDPGIDASDVLSVALAPAPGEYDDARALALYDELIERVRELPGVTDVGAIHLLPYTAGNWSFPYLADGHTPPANEPLPSANFRVITPGYFDALDIPLLSGRDFTATDRGADGMVGIINRTLAEQLWPGQDAVGRTIRLFGSSPFRVVGVVGDVRQHALDREAAPEIYFPQGQWTLSSMTLVVETEGNPAGLESAIRSIVRSIDVDVPVVAAQPLAVVIDATLVRRRFFLSLLTTFGVVALALGAIGIYGVLTYAAQSRVQEFGVRVALGATPRDIVRSAIASGVVPIACGLLAGTATALASGRLLAGMLYGVQPHDGRTLLIAAVVLTAVALLACWLPARRASRSDPVRVLSGG